MIFEGESFYNYAYALNVEKARCEALDHRPLCYKVLKQS